MERQAPGAAQPSQIEAGAGDTAEPGWAVRGGASAVESLAERDLRDGQAARLDEAKPRREDRHRHQCVHSRMRDFEEPGTKRWHEKSGPDETGAAA